MTAVLLLSACGKPSPTNAPVVIKGSLSGIFQYGYPAACAPGQTRIAGTFGPDPQADAADLTVSDQDFIALEPAGNRGTYTGSGVSFRPGSGWDIDAQLHSGLTRTITIKGHVQC